MKSELGPMVHLLVRGHFDRHQMFSAAVFYGPQTQVELLLARGSIGIDARNSNGDTALILACRVGRGIIANMMLLSQGANVAIFNHRQKSALYWTSMLNLIYDPDSDVEVNCKVVSGLVRDGAVLGLRYISTPP